MIKFFELDHVSKSAKVHFNTEKLLWLKSSLHFVNLPPEYVAKHLAWHYKESGIDTSNGPALTGNRDDACRTLQNPKKWPQQAVISSKSLKVLMKQR